MFASRRMKIVTALAADDTEADVATLRLELFPAVVGCPADVRVERTGQAPVASEDHQHHVLGLAARKQGMDIFVCTHARGHSAQDLVRLEGVGPKALDVLLCLTQPSTGH